MTHLFRLTTLYRFVWAGVLLGLGLLFSCGQPRSDQKEAVADTTSIQPVKIGGGNPIIAGYFADPTVIRADGHFYLYATIDPWGGDSLAVFRSADFHNWERIPLNWPTKAQCMSPTSNDSRVWAPSVVKGTDGKYHMFVSVGSEVYAGVSDQPEGPWHNVKSGGSPLITTQKADNIHTIDAEVFVDTDGQAYLYWGSGWNWTNGHCLVAKLNPEMSELTTEPQDITPPNYFEAPYMLKRDSLYYLMYSKGKCTDSTYQVRYSVATSPFGPFVEGKNSPILRSIPSTKTIGPGHHTIVQLDGNYYIVYHRISAASGKDLLRELCADPLYFDETGAIQRVNPTD